MRALRDRPTALERWPKGVRDGIRLATGRRRQGRRVLPEAGAQGRARLRGDGEITFPSGRTADEICPTELATVAWAAQMGTITFHPWPVRRADVDQPGRAADRPRPAAGHRLRRRRPGRRRRPRAARRRSGWSASRRPAATAACTSTSGSSRGGTSSTSGTRRSRSAASWSAARPAVTTNWWKEERGETRSSSTSTRTPATAPSPRPTRCGRMPGAPVSTPVDVGRARRGRDPRDAQPAHGAGAVRRARRPCTAAIDDGAGDLTPLLELYDDDSGAGLATCPTRRTTRRCRASRRGCSPARRSPRTGTS